MVMHTQENKKEDIKMPIFPRDTIYERNDVCAYEDASINEIAKLMRENHIGDVVIVKYKDAKKIPVGIITDRDLTIEMLAQDVPTKNVIASDLMLHSLTVVREDDGVYDVIKTMKKKGVGRIPVVNSDGSLVGIVTAKKILQLLVQELSDLVSFSEKQQLVEKTFRH